MELHDLHQLAEGLINQRPGLRDEIERWEVVVRQDGTLGMRAFFKASSRPLTTLGAAEVWFERGNGDVHFSQETWIAFFVGWLAGMLDEYTTWRASPAASR